MKPNVVYFTILRILVVLFLLISFTGYSQPDYIFQNSQLLSGTNLQVGALYKFPLVKPGIDARVAITAISPGVTLTEIDGTSGYDEAFQPTLTVASMKSGYVEFSINFVAAGTTTSSVQAKVAATCVDVDGTDDIHEFDQLYVGGGYADFTTLGGELTVSWNANWFTGKNIGGITYPGRDTTAKGAMFTIVNVNISSMIIRVGIDNQSSSSASRLRSVYFKRFLYANSALALSEAPNRLRRERAEIAENNFKILPTAIQSSAKISVMAKEDGWAMFQLVDYSGKIITQQQIVINKGFNNIPIFNVSGISKGNYVAVLKIDGKTYSQKIIKQ